MIKIMDLHSDILTYNDNLKENIKKVKKDEKCGYKSINAIYNDNLKLEKALEIVDECKSENVNTIAFENCCYEDYILKDSNTSKCILSNVEELAKIISDIKPMYVSLTWNYDNIFAGGSKGNSGLSTYGRTFIEILNKNNIAIDTAHLNKKSFYDVIKYAEKVLCTHTAIYDILPHKRNIDYEMIREILNRKGIIGLTFVGYFLKAERGDVNYYESGFYEHIEGFIEKFGVDGLAIGSDFYGTDAPAFKNGNYQNLYEKLNCWFSDKKFTNFEKQSILCKNALNFFK